MESKLQSMSNPLWYGNAYPSMEDLSAFAESLGALVGYCDMGGEAIYFAGEGLEPPVILLPTGVGLLRLAWTLAHELGHLVQHSGPKGELMWGKNERQADEWAACALIPKARIRRHRNASLDAFIGALSAHYEDLPLESCPERELAARIARIRIQALHNDPVYGEQPAYRPRTGTE